MRVTHNDSNLTYSWDDGSYFIAAALLKYPTADAIISDVASAHTDTVCVEVENAVESAWVNSDPAGG